MPHHIAAVGIFLLYNSDPSLSGKTPYMNVDQTITFLTTLEPEVETHEFLWTGLHSDGRQLQQYGTVEAMLPKLAERNAAGFGIFVSVNAIDRPVYVDGFPKRRAQDITRVRAVFADWDDPNADMEPPPLEPTMVVETSPRKFHFYWCVEDVPLDQFEGLQRGISQALGTDKSVIDLSRVLRVPERFLHTKDPDNMPEVRLDYSGGPRYTLMELLEAFPYDPLKHRPKFSTWNGQDVERKTAMSAAVVAAMHMPRLDGGYNVRCPWEAEHTTPSSETSTTYWPPSDKNDGRGSFVCMHAHCRNIRMVAEYDAWISRNVATFMA